MRIISLTAILTVLLFSACSRTPYYEAPNGRKFVDCFESSMRGRVMSNPIRLEAIYQALFWQILHSSSTVPASAP